MASAAAIPEVQVPANAAGTTPDPAIGAPLPQPPAPAPPAEATPAASIPFERADQRLLDEIAEFRADSEKRYAFNNRWDIVLSVAGIVLSIVVVWAGFRKPDPQELIAILGALVGAIVTAQRAFPFGQRAGFYRLLIGQVRNLATRATQGTFSKVEVINALSSLRMDFAQQLPRGSSGPAPTTAPSTPQPADPPAGDADGQQK